ncbi:MAG TPA: class I SAM-dependent methyltransferase [Candidatus Tumulicola sp.]
MNDDHAMAAQAAIASRVAELYERYPYPPPIDRIEANVSGWDAARRRAESFLFCPGRPYSEDRTILVAGCGTVQAARYAVRWPRSRVVGIDFSPSAIEYELQLKKIHGLENLELHRIPVERAADLDEHFDLVVCTGVLHHLEDPDAGLAALRNVLAADGAMHLMVYASYGRAGVYMLQEYCRRLGLTANDSDIDDVIETLKALPSDHPIVKTLRSSPDFSSHAGVADALLHPNDRAYTVAEFTELLNRAGIRFGRWVRQAPYLPWCGTPATLPHAEKLRLLPETEQYSALELFRGTMVRHTAIAYRSGTADHTIDFEGDDWMEYVPIRMPDTTIVHDRLPPGASAVLINRNHTFTDLFLPIDARQERLLEAIDGKRRIRDMGRATADLVAAREFFQQLWRWDQIVFDTTGTGVRRASD